MLAKLTYEDISLTLLAALGLPNATQVDSTVGDNGTSIHWWAYRTGLLDSSCLRPVVPKACSRVKSLGKERVCHSLFPTGIAKQLLIVRKTLD